MAGIYRSFNLSVDIPYHVRFVCEKCGNNNNLRHAVKAASSYSDRGALRNKTIEGRKNKAAVQLAEQRKKLIERIEVEKDRKRYHTVHLTCKCSKCSHLPAWAYPDWFRIADRIKEISLFIALMVFLFMCLAWLDGGQPSWKPFLIAAAPAVLYLLGLLIYTKWQDVQIDRMEERYLPFLVLADKK